MIDLRLFSDFPFLIAPSVYLQELSPFNSDKISAVLLLFIEHFNIATSYEITIALRLGKSKLIIIQTDKISQQPEN
jgi:hypothetical protein